MHERNLQFVIPRNARIHRVGEIWSRAMMPTLTVDGLTNVEKARSLNRQNKSVLVVANHVSNIDTFAIDNALDMNSAKDLSDKTVWMYGIRLEEGRITRVMSDAFDRIRVFPPTIQTETEELREQKKTMNENAYFAAQQEALKGRVIGIYPEGTRSREPHSAMREANPATEPYLELTEDTWVLGVALQGTEKVLPVGREIPLPHSVSVTFTEPQSVSAIRQGLTHLKGKPLRRAIWDAIMVPIAEELPEEMQGYYRDKVAAGRVGR